MRRVMMIMLMPTTGRSGEITVRLEEADAEDQRKRNQGSGGSDDPRTRLNFTDSGLYGAQNMVFHQIAFVEQDHVGIAKLVVGGGTVKKIQTEVFGIRDRDHRIEANAIAKFRPQECQNYRQGVGKPGRFDN